MTPHDEWDYDGIKRNDPLGPEHRRSGPQAADAFDRNGLGYTLDRAPANAGAQKYDPKVN